MHWTHDRPTEPGWFWFRDFKRGLSEQVVEVELVPKMGFIAQKELCFDGELVNGTPKTSEWAGPIQAPNNRVP